MTILVTGGTGKTGRRLAARLESRGIVLRIASRHAPARFDWADAATGSARSTGFPPSIWSLPRIIQTLARS